MLLIRCQCGHQQGVQEPAALGQPVACPACGGVLRPVAPGPLPGDTDFFTARLVIVAGPQRVGEQILLGGHGPIEIGKHPSRAVMLAGELVSRMHARLLRAGAGWQIEDRQSTNGLFVNGQRVERVELHPGDRVTVGEYQLQYHQGLPARPSLWRRLFPGADATP